MGVGFNLIGRYGTPDGGPDDAAADWLDRVQDWLEANGGEPLEAARQGEDHEGRPCLFVQLHPGAEAIELVVPESGLVVVSGRSSSVGPGFHIYACDLLHRLGTDLGIAWEERDEENGTGDETGYFHTGDRAAVEAEVLKWLRTIASVIQENLDTEYPWMMISMPMAHHYHHHGSLVTPLGPRDRTWLDAVVADPRQGIDLFPWWSAGIHADFYRGRALSRIWQQVRWRTPLTREEGELQVNTHLDLARAYRLDPSLAYPWREWEELLNYIAAYFGYVEMDGEDIEAEIRRRAAAEPDRPLLGYRRQPVRVILVGGWSIEIPGEMAEAWEPDGRWSAWDERRTVWFSSMSLTDQDDNKPAAEEILASTTMPEGQRWDWQGERVIGHAVLCPYEENGEQLWQLAAQGAVAGELALCNIFIKDLADRDWALATWQSLDFPEPDTEDDTSEESPA